MAEGTAALRAAAPRWSLAADRQLLDLLQRTHQGIISRCNETHARLEEMARGLRDASVNLQNVNNKFLALSNTQFVESRVYDDDADVAPAPAPAHPEPPQAKPQSPELAAGARLAAGLRALAAAHAPLRILRDSDSASDSDDGDDRLVLKPRDLYADRPLPHVIGSRAWRTKWHAGLVHEESDSDSSESKAADVEQYSESDDDAPAHSAHAPARGEISTGSSSAPSEAAVSVSRARPSPSAAAAELARRLGGDYKIPEKEPLYEPDTATRKLYKPQQPVATTIFPDEPPPLDETSSDEDIFAELHKPRPNAHSTRVEGDLFDFAPKTNSLEDALFGRRERSGVAESNQPKKGPLFEEEAETEQVPREAENRRDDNVKKPVGGISLFGTNKHAETIGPAILKRNRRESSSSDDDNTEEVREEVKDIEAKEVKKERDIFDDLFAKSERLNKKSAKIDEPKVEVKKDVFSDLFDDIDDIFSTDIVNVKVKETKTNEKSLFSDDDDLFAEVSKVNKDTEREKAKANEKSQFNDVTKLKNNSIVKESKNIVIVEVKKESKGIFDSDSDDGLFSNTSKTTVTEKKINNIQDPVKYKISDDIFSQNNDADLFGKNKPPIKEKKLDEKITEINQNTLFDSDDELLTNNVKENTTHMKESGRNDNITEAFNTDSENALFDSDDDGLFKKNIIKTETTEVKKNDTFIDNNTDIFVATAKQPENELRDKIEITSDADELFFKTKEKEKALKVVESINSDVFNDGDELFKKTEALKETKIETIHDSFFDEPLTNENDSITEPLQEETQSDESLNNDFENEPVDIDNDIYKHDEQTENILRTSRIALDVENEQKEKVKQALFSDSDDELFKTISVPKLKDSDKFKHESRSTKLSEPQKQTSKADIFSDIFDDIPPIFEKPKEPKKSRNVNALFDDDSDDEALFFKKNDVITDEKPDFSPSVSEERFGIFNDEPPAIDVDFTQKTNDFAQKPHKTEKQIQKVDGISDSALKTDVIEETQVKTTKSAEAILVKDDRDTTDNTDKEPKKVGKLKPMNFNINVNTLLPGASPKKKQSDNTDGQTASSEDLHVIDRIEHKMVKSISFDDPEILDNKISKERAKIQVKRRPSTRRARKEAVRKSAIDLTDSSYDSVNDSAKDVTGKIVKTVYILNDDDIFGNKSEKNEHVVSPESTKKHLDIVDSDEELNKSIINQKNELDSRLTYEIKNINDQTVGDKKISFLDSDEEDLFHITTSKSEAKHEQASALDSDDNDDLFRQKNTKISSTTPNSSKSSNIPVSNIYSNVEGNKKIVEEMYKGKTILNSDDIDDLFTNKNAKTTTTPKSISSDDEDLFTANKKGIKTLGKVYESKNAKMDNRESIFDDFASDTKVDNNKSNKVSEKANVEKPAMKKSLLDDSSDEDDLFKARTTLAAKKNVKSLFGDDDDENLFAAKTVKEPKQTPVPRTSREAKTAEPVFEDPLSLFGNDE